MANLLTTPLIRSAVLRALGAEEVGWQTGNSVVLNHDAPIVTRALYGWRSS